MSLCNKEKSALAIARFSKYTPDMIDANQNKHQEYRSQLESLENSKKFFKTQYSNEDKKKYLAQINKEIKKVYLLLEENPKLESLARLNMLEAEGLSKSLQILINDLRLFFAVDNMISTEGIKGLCPLIIIEFPNLTIEDVAVCFSKAKKGHYKELYNRLDGAIIMSWLQQYNLERLERIKERNYVANAHHKIGIGEGRKSMREDSAHLLSVAQTVVMLEKANKK